MLIFHGNNGYSDTPHCYIIHALCLVLNAINSNCGLRPFPYRNNTITIISSLFNVHFQSAEHWDVLVLSAETASNSVPPPPLLFDLGATLLGHHILQKVQQNSTWCCNLAATFLWYASVSKHWIAKAMELNSESAAWKHWTGPQPVIDHESQMSFTIIVNSCKAF